MLSTLFNRCARRHRLYRPLKSLSNLGDYHSTSLRLNISQNYLDKVQKRAEQQGVSVDELKQRIKQSAKPKPLPEAQTLQEQRAKKLEADRKSNGHKPAAFAKSERKDESPVKHLAEIMDIHKILRTPHTAEQISALWTAFHASRSGGTGRGYLSASVPLQTYETLIESGKKHPTFIIPLIREASQATESAEGTTEKQEPAYEFFFMQWAFHPAPSIPTPSVLDLPLPEDALSSPPVHPIATVLFTPLLEYKTRATFATPHLVLTLYPELAQSHQLVLLRGELTPSPSDTGRYLLSQQEAQLLALGLQRFYLANREEERAELLRVFSESPSEFQWEELLKHANPTS
ncbi:ATP11-domain-containing protein [Fomitiporia mediterranea MF3/22]|uniref:ATP11-domain-containing protein n=1 Tax=Fomitiporia mediterranea (strain MF3/22) TaxID=694068 RepID=UPI0004407E56|nr:ATP11-domain-containing protein [Fomitiporia mediterranea MF3/22]EJD04550.1 ATP11-domain-containing protein [Fomitiporia mediterranea MF3/22]